MMTEQNTTEYKEEPRAELESYLRPGLNALGLPETAAVPMSRHGALLLERNQVMNLTALTTPEETARLHFLDSAALVPLVRFRGKSLIDVGSGGGFPGLPLKVLEPSLKLTLLDAQRKRVEFLRDACGVCGVTDGVCVQARAEDYAREHREGFDLATARAVAALPILAELCLPLVRVGGQFLAMKSVHSQEELDGASRALSLLGGRLEAVHDYPVPGTEIRHRLIVIRKERKTPLQYPRAYGKIKKQPL